jgi:hypothetical protein
MLTGGEKYNTKCIIIKIKDIYPNIESILSNEKYENDNSSLSSLYDYTLEIFLALTGLTTNIISSNLVLQEIFNMLQEVHYYKDVNRTNKPVLISVVGRIPELQDELIKLVEGDTTNRDAVLRQIMDELGIVDPNAKKKRSLW